MMFMRSFLSCASMATVLTLASPVAAQHAQHYVLDGFGGVHAGGGAPAISPPTPYFGFDVAVDIVYIPVGTLSAAGDGVLVLDAFGGVHRGGSLVAAPPSGGTPYFGFDIARAIASRDVPPRGAGAVNGNSVTLATSTTFTVLASLTIVAPDNGILFVTGTTEMFCSTDFGDIAGEVAVNIDSTQPVNNFNYVITIQDCSGDAGGFPEHRTVTLAFPFATTPGTHTVYLLARKNAGFTDPIFSDRTLTAIFVDHNAVGGSVVEVAGAPDPNEGRINR